MRVSNLFFRTLKEKPADAEIISHALLEQAGYFLRIGQGIFSYTPLLTRVLYKLTNLIRQELENVGCQEFIAPLLHPESYWKKSGRWEGYLAEKLLFTLTDRHDKSYCLAPTHEEIATYLVSQIVQSHKNLPLNIFQFGPKFRDEIRPRFGLMRSKEFIMKDGYSFSSDASGMQKQYDLMHKAYTSIFTKLNLHFVSVEADSGKIGKGKSEEFQVLADIGEDALLVSDSFACNVEAAKTELFLPQKEPLKNKRLVPTPNISTIEELSIALKVPKEKILKVVVYKLIFAKESRLVAVAIRGDRQINTLKLQNHFAALEIELATDQELRAHNLEPGFIPPDLSIEIVGDKSIQPMQNFVSATGKKDEHFLDQNFTTLPSLHDFLLVQEGDICPETKKPYELKRGIEVGHVFNLHTNYSEKIGAYFQDANGKMQPCWMGTYGIGVGRVVAAVVEQSHDDRGIIWPMIIAPYCLTITAANNKDEEQSKAAEKIYELLKKEGFFPLLDDRNERLGFKLRDSDLIGIPFKLIVGKKISEGEVEIESRRGEKSNLPLDQILPWALSQKMC